MKRHLAIDLGASSGRGIIGTIEGGRIKLSELHRFSNDPVETPQGFFWDTLRLVHEIKTGHRELSCGKRCIYLPQATDESTAYGSQSI